MAVEKRKITALVSFDFSKAFDTIDHGLLISKLRRLGCDALAVEWFSSYLSSRSLSVKSEDGALSEQLFTTSGIPQGSSLGPLLFAIFINDLHIALRHSKHIIYADDTAIFHHHFPSRIHELIADLNADANAVAAWAAENKLHLNPTKATFMILGSLAYVSSIDKAALPKITLNGTSIAYSSSIKCLGVTISPTLLWTKHINSLSHEDESHCNWRVQPFGFKVCCNRVYFRKGTDGIASAQRYCSGDSTILASRNACSTSSTAYSSSLSRPPTYQKCSRR
ncbi:unnamed protein product [Trichogramma brassicae]|uniref:Reverse transcriptase domain-containing protein n=1 Tax=Trichogramma brassicae TaxID=86971 RepID=A0A6H5J420_9HYME|nr:unnamed protein product [Trichogramma brassicae]